MIICPKCHTENPDDAQTCLHCDVALDEKARLSFFAVAAIVAGLLGFCTSGITATLGIVLGFIALFQIRYSKASLLGYKHALIGIILSAAMLIAVFQMKPHIHFFSYKIGCQKNMGHLAQLLYRYADSHQDQLPPLDQWCDTLKQLYPQDAKGVFACPADPNAQCSYALNSALKDCRLKELPPEMVLIFESQPGWNLSGQANLMSNKNHQGYGCNVIFVDLHAELVPPERFTKLHWQP